MLNALLYSITFTLHPSSQTLHALPKCLFRILECAICNHFSNFSIVILTTVHRSSFLQLFAKRMKVASETERESLKQLDSRYMSDEEDGEEGEGGAWVVRSPPWRSQRLSSLLRRLQERVNSKQTPSSHPQNPRVPGMPSMRSPPKSSPPWAVDWSGEHQTPPSFDTPRAEIQQRTPRNHRTAQVKKVPRAGRHRTTPSCLEERVDGALCQRSTEYSSPQSSQSDNFWDSDEIWSVVCQNAPVRERRRKRVLDSESDSDRE